ncbi:putative type VI secretion system effector [Paraburkholderia caffeinilytica]|uniref:putative type VI secretion system effector n=1 Tax=Paraburkholderia caffeinilytica TaxID=1761016 RepID=UPI003DA1B99D
MLEQADRPALLRGRIVNLVRTKTTRDFMRTESEKIATSIGTVALGLSGMTALAVGVSTAAGNSAEEVDKVSFQIEGVRVEGWLWRFPFRESDEVEVVVEKSNVGVTCFAVRRLEDELVAVYPHCTSGRKAYVKKSVKICTALLGIWISVMACLFFMKAPELTLPQKFYFLGVTSAFPALFLLFFALSAYRKDKVFIAISERMFETFGWHDPARIDLKKTSKGKKKKSDGSGYGLWIFRY